MFEVIGGCGQGYALQSQWTCYAVDTHVVELRDSRDEASAAESMERSEVLDGALWYLAY